MKKLLVVTLLFLASLFPSAGTARAESNLSCAATVNAPFFLMMSEHFYRWWALNPYIPTNGGCSLNMIATIDDPSVLNFVGVTVVGAHHSICSVSEDRAQITCRLFVEGPVRIAPILDPGREGEARVRLTDTGAGINQEWNVTVWEEAVALIPLVSNGTRASAVSCEPSDC